MNRHRLLVLAIAGLAVATPSAAAERSDVIRRELTLAPEVRTVEIDNVFGGVEVRAGEQGRVSIEIRRKATARYAADLDRALEEVQLEIDEWSRGVSLIQDGPFRCEARGRDRRDRRHRWGDCRWEPGYELDWQWIVTVPAEVDLEVHTVNGGDVSVDGLRGDLLVANVNGGLRLRGLVGRVQAATVNGEIDAEYAAVPTREGRFATVNGDVEIALPEASSLDVELETMNGELWSDFDVAAVPQRAEPAASRPLDGRFRLEHDTVVRIGSGGPRFECQTLNGDIVLRRR